MIIIADERLDEHVKTVKLATRASPWKTFPVMRRWLVTATDKTASPDLTSASRPVVADSIPSEHLAQAIVTLPDVLEELQQLRFTARQAIACLKNPRGRTLGDLNAIIAAAARIGID